MNKVLEQLRKVPGALLLAEWHAGYFFLEVHSLKPILDRRRGVAFQYRGHSLYVG
jgi:hypothetical protein